MWHHQDRRRRGPVSSPASWTTRGEDHPTARLSGPGPRKVWQRVQELARRARRTVSLRYTDRDSRPLQGGDSKNAIAWPAPRTQPASSTPFTSSSSPVTPLMRYVVASSKTPWVTAGARMTPSIQVRNLLRTSHTQAHPTSTRTPPRGLHGR